MTWSRTIVDKLHGNGRWCKQESAGRRRAQARGMMRNGRFDDVRSRYPRDILWNWL